MQFFKSTKSIVAALPALAAGPLAPKDLNVADPASIAGVAKTIAAAAMSYYPGTATTLGDLPAPHYWWQLGALMGAMVDYTHYTKDQTYSATVANAILGQIGPTADFMLPSHFGQLGNDDQGIWSLSVMTAAEVNLPQPESNLPSWLKISENTFNSLISYWNTSACGGGLLWQKFASNPNGLDYRNSVSSGSLFQLSARLARATGNQTYVDWAKKVWDWSVAVGFIAPWYEVFDGASSSDNCKNVNPVTFSYGAGIYMYGAAVLANYTQDPIWETHAAGILKESETFFNYNNTGNIMYEHACEQVDKCNQDMKSFKGYLSRFMFKSAVLVPSLQAKVNEYMDVTVPAAAKACTGGSTGTQCGQKWYVGGFDGSVGLGQDMCALETIQGMLARQSAPPFKGAEIKDVRVPASGKAPAPAPNADPAPAPTKRSNGAGSLKSGLGWTAAVGGLVGVVVFGLI